MLHYIPTASGSNTKIYDDIKKIMNVKRMFKKDGFSRMDDKNSRIDVSEDDKQ
jgi:hypothetical protein